MKQLLSIIAFAIFSFNGSAQNSMTGDGFGGRSWYRAHNYQAGAYSAYTVCDSNNQLYGWGNNIHGELGTGNFSGTVMPVKVLGMTNVEFYTTGYISGAIKNDKTAWVWGFGSGGSGNPSNSGFSNIPTQVLTDVKFVDGGINHVVFVKNDGTVWGAGQNADGQLGIGTKSPLNAPVTTPVKMTGVTNAVRAVASGLSWDSLTLPIRGATIILLSDGTVKITGGYKWFTDTSTTVPITIAGLTNIVDIKANTEAAYALNSAGEVYSFGKEEARYQVLGLGPYTGSLTSPTKITFPSGAAPIVALSTNNAGYTVLALDEGGKVYGWGDNTYGQLGDGTAVSKSTPTLIATSVIDIFAGETFSYVLKSDNTLYATGISYGVSGYAGSIWMDLSNLQRNTFTKIQPTIAPMNLCAPHINGLTSLTPDCTPGRFYAIDFDSPNRVHSFTLFNDSVIYNGALAISNSSVTSARSLAVATFDSVPAFYSNTAYVWLYKLTNKWDTIFTSGGQILNSGGNNQYLYYQTALSGGGQEIKRFNGSSLTTILTSNSTFGIQDLAVDSVGNVYYFDKNGGSLILKVISPSGVLLSSYVLPATGENGYGCFFIGNTLYVGLGPSHPTHPNSLLPITITGSGVTLGRYIKMPFSRNYSDLASCGNFKLPSPCPTAPSLPVVTSMQPNCMSSIGSITITSPVGSTLKYSIDSGSTYTTNTSFPNLVSGTYYILVKDTAGCTSQPTVVTINPAPVTPAAPTVSTVQPTCTSSTGTVSVTSPAAGLTYSIDSINYSAGTTFTNLAAATYSVTAKSIHGCVSPATTVTINAAPGTPPAPTLNVTQTTCTTSTGSISITNPIGAAFSYSINGVDYSNTTGLFTSVAPGSYNVTVRNNSGCISDLTAAVINTALIVPQTPAVTVTQPTCSVPLGTITVTSPIANAMSYSINGTTYQPNNVFSSVTPDTYNVTVFNGNCKSAITTVAINAAPSLVLTLSATPNPVNAGGTVNLVVTGNSPFTVTRWQPFLTFPNQTATAQTIVVNTPATYTVTGKTGDDCIDTAQVSVTLKSIDDVWVPNVFTPDHNGLNDIFYVYGSSIDKLELVIWNQWGEKMFATKDKNDGWDGTSKSKAQPIGVYVYVAKVTLQNGKEIVKRGAVNLLR